MVLPMKHFYASQVSKPQLTSRQYERLVEQTAHQYQSHSCFAPILLPGSGEWLTGHLNKLLRGKLKLSDQRQ